jgi:hypothetical protein
VPYAHFDHISRGHRFSARIDNTRSCVEGASVLDPSARKVLRLRSSNGASVLGAPVEVPDRTKVVQKRGREDNHVPELAKEEEEEEEEEQEGCAESGQGKR